MLYFDILDRMADSSVPVFLLLTDGGYWDRLGRRYWSAVDLDLLAKCKKNYQWLPYERGVAPVAYRAVNPGLPYADGATPPSAPPLWPDETWTKANILTWLSGNGVDIAERHLGNLSKVELLAFIDDMQDLP